MQRGQVIESSPPRVAAGLSARLLFAALRPRQWTKNGLLFIPLAFTLNLDQPDLLARTALAFALFCALSSAGYLLNDLRDAEADRQHPVKRFRPIASGALSTSWAVALAAVLALVGVGGAFTIRPLLGLLAVGYLALTTSYSIWLKHVVLVDIFAIAAGFVLRAAAGAVAIDVPISPWLYTATMLGALLIALGKRRAELTVLGEDAHMHRPNLEAYSVAFVDQLIMLISSAAIITYALYTFSADNLPRDHRMMLTVPVVLYGLFRYLYLVQTGTMGGTPEELLLRDRPLQAAVIAWALLTVGLLYFGAAV